MQAHRCRPVLTLLHQSLAQPLVRDCELPNARLHTQTRQFWLGHRLLGHSGGDVHGMWVLRPTSLGA